MSLESLLDLRYGDGVYADPEAVTAIGRVLLNGNSYGEAASIIVCKRPALLCGFSASSVAAQYIQVFDASALPANAAVPLLSFVVGATSTASVSFLPYPRSFRNGIVLCNSSTQNAKTIGSADTIFDVQFI